MEIKISLRERQDLQDVARSIATMGCITFIPELNSPIKPQTAKLPQAPSSPPGEAAFIPGSPLIRKEPTGGGVAVRIRPPSGGGTKHDCSFLQPQSGGAPLLPGSG